MGKLSQIVDKLSETDGVKLERSSGLQGVHNEFKDVAQIVVLNTRHARHLGAVSAIACDLGIVFSPVYDHTGLEEAAAASTHFDAEINNRLVIIAPNNDPYDTIGALRALNHLPNIYARATFEIE